MCEAVIRIEKLYDLPRILMITYETLSEKQSDLREWARNISAKFTIHKKDDGRASGWRAFSSPVAGRILEYHL